MINIFKKTVSGFVLLLAMCCGAQKASAQPGASVSIQTFYDELEPYGQWIDDPELGYVWAPDAGPDFRPYATNGHWAATEFGNTWVSDYDWGWAAFHYGRWRFANDYGWEWIPGTEWGPAWVNWRTGGDYYGWAPLGPGIGIDISFGSGYYAPDNYWIFAPRRYVYEPNIYRYYLPVNRNFNIIRNTTIISNVYVNDNRRYISGPRPDDVRRYTNVPINIYNINDSHRPGGSSIRNNTLNIYRPQIAANHDGNRPEPSRIINQGSYNRNQGFNNGGNSNANSGFNGRQPGNQGNVQSGSSSNNNNSGFGRGNNNGSNGSPIPQRSISNQNSNNGAGQTSGSAINQTGNSPANGFGGRSNSANQPAQNQNLNNGAGQTSGSAINQTGNNPANGFGGRSNPANQPVQTQNGNNTGNSFGGRSNQPAQNQSGQPNTDWRQSRDFDRNRTRNDIQLQQNQNQQNQINQQQNQQRQQQNQQQMQQRQQQNQQRLQQNQQRQMQQNQRQQPQPQQQQRPERQEKPERNNS
ncbi:MAG: DUF6600 domain-containing protein [Janthinobacterium lividum]